MNQKCLGSSVQGSSDEPVRSREQTTAAGDHAGTGLVLQQVFAGSCASGLGQILGQRHAELHPSVPTAAGRSVYHSSALSELQSNMKFLFHLSLNLKYAINSSFIMQ